MNNVAKAAARLYKDKTFLEYPTLDVMNKNVRNLLNKALSQKSEKLSAKNYAARLYKNKGFSQKREKLDCYSKMISS